MSELDESKAEAKRLAKFAKEHGVPCAFEVVQLGRRNVAGKLFEVQPFGIHVRFKSHKLMHVEPIPGGAR